MIRLIHSVEVMGTPFVLFDTKGDVGKLYQVLSNQISLENFDWLINELIS